MAVSISSRGKSLHDDCDHAGLLGLNYLASFRDDQKTALINAIHSAIQALGVDAHGTHGNNFTIAASLTSNSVSITIS